MVTRDDLEQLVKNRGQEAVGAAVVKIPDEDVRPALMLIIKAQCPSPLGLGRKNRDLVLHHLTSPCGGKLRANDLRIFE